MNIFIPCITLFVITYSHPLNPPNYDESVESSEENSLSALFQLDSQELSDFEEHIVNPRKTGFFRCKIQGQLAVPGECNKYFICQRAGLRSTNGFCSAKKRFHHQKRRCLVISEDECRASMCQKVTDRFPDPYMKENYLTCFQMFPQVTPCPEGNIYNKTTTVCEPGSPLAGLKTSAELDPPIPKGNVNKIEYKNTTAAPDPDVIPENYTETSESNGRVQVNNINTELKSDVEVRLDKKAEENTVPDSDVISLRNETVI